VPEHDGALTGVWPPAAPVHQSSLVWRPGDGGAEPEAAALGESEAQAWREAKRGAVN
jgi:hypothetical protein